MRRMWKKLLPTLVVAALLCACGAQTPAEAPHQPEQPGVVIQQEESAPSAVPEQPQAEMGQTEPPREEPVPEAPVPGAEPDAVASATPEDAPEPVDPEQAQSSDTLSACTISISCAVLREHMEELAPEKTGLVPEDGWILPPVEAAFQEGESVFDLLQRVCQENRIHLEFVDTPGYRSAYIEGIHNLYEFDCGNLSGWVYSVNDWFPNYGCSRYQLQSGDVVCWQYTCDLGQDVNGQTVPAQGA